MLRLGSVSLRVGVLIATLSAVGCADSDPRRAPPLPDTPTVNYKIGAPYQVAGVWYYPREDYGYIEDGVASWYGDDFHGRPTANGEVFDMNAMTAAHRTLPMPSLVRVTNLDNGRSTLLRINDRGPFVNNRIIDVSRVAASELGFLNAGTANVRVEILAEESRQLAAVGHTAALSADERADAAPVTRVASESLGAPGSVAPTIAETTPTVTGRVAPSTPAIPGQLFVQAGSFMFFENANKMAAQLAWLGPTRIVQAEVQGVPYHRVLLGPINDSDAATMLLDRVTRAGVQNAAIVTL